MKNADVLKILDDIKNIIAREEYEEALNYIKQKKIEIKNETDASEKYIDELLDNLK